MRKSFSLNLAAGVLGVGLAAAPSFADIKISDGLALSGFLDMAVVSTLPDGGDPTLNAAFDQFELDFLYKFSDKLTARVDLNAVMANGAAVTLEQGFLTYTTGPLAISTGKFLSASGFEAAEPTGLYQYSTSKTLVYGGYQNGANVAYTLSPMISLYGAVVGSVWDNTDTELTEPGYEAQISLMPVTGATIKAGYFTEDVGDFYTGLTNVWASYVAGPLTVAAEFNHLTNWFGDHDADDDTPNVPIEDNGGIGYLVMANFKLNDKLGITGRYSAIDTDVGGLDNEVTVSPGYAISNAWFVLAEVKYELELKRTNFAVESILTF
jgi:hypothetical protein